MQLVVGVALLLDGRVLSARRTSPPEVAGGWELPGGKVEPGESPEAAARREIREELGCDIEVTGWLPGEQQIRPGLILRVATAVPSTDELEPHEHDALRWLGRADLDTVAWLPADVPFLPALRELLQIG